MMLGEKRSKFRSCLHVKVFDLGDLGAHETYRVEHIDI